MSASYRIYNNSGAGPIDYATPAATTQATTWTDPTPLAPGAWKWGVRAYDGFGDGGFGCDPWSGFGSPWGADGFAGSTYGTLDDGNLDCAAAIAVSAGGDDQTNLPAAPHGLRAFPTAGAGLRVEWWSPPVSGPAAPTGFRVYAGTPTISYAAGPAAVVAPSSSRLGVYQASLAGLTPGSAYAIGVRAWNGTGEEPNTATVSATTSSAGPAAVTTLTATTIP